MRCLIVLDDVWEAKFLAPLTCIDDEATNSKVLISTRICGLVEGALEVGVGSLSEEEAVSLLAATAEIELARPSRARTATARKAVRPPGCTIVRSTSIAAARGTQRMNE